MNSNYEFINKALLKNIERLEKLDINDEKARDEIMRSNAIQMSAKTFIQSQITNMAVIKYQEKIDKETLLIENFMGK